jgi:hypothetical protein
MTLKEAYDLKQYKGKATSTSDLKLLSEAEHLIEVMENSTAEERKLIIAAISRDENYKYLFPNGELPTEADIEQHDFEGDVYSYTNDSESIQYISKVIKDNNGKILGLFGYLRTIHPGTEKPAFGEIKLLSTNIDASKRTLIEDVLQALIDFFEKEHASFIEWEMNKGNPVEPIYKAITALFKGTIEKESKTFVFRITEQNFEESGTKNLNKKDIIKKLFDIKRTIA